MSITSLLATSDPSGSLIGGILLLIFLIWFFCWFVHGVGSFFKWLLDRDKGWIYEEHRRGELKKRK